MGFEKEIEEAVRILAGTFNKDDKNFVFCEVTAVSKEDRTCDAIPISGDNETSFEGILLSAEPNDGVLKIPSIGSTVLVVYGNRDSAYVIMFSDIDEYIITIKDGSDEMEFSMTKYGIKLNGDAFGGLVKLAETVEKFNNLEEKVNEILTAFNSWVVVPNDGGAALKAFFIPPSTLLTPTTELDLENTKVKQGG